MASSRIFSLLTLTATILACDGPSTVNDPTRNTRDADSRPNIIVILTDDQGYADLGSNGTNADIQTPHIDALAAQGVTMTAGYASSPQCSPSRAGLLTGKYQQRFGFDNNKDTPLPLTETTVADHMQAAGYRTGMVGKWHLEVLKDSDGFDLDNMSVDEQQIYFPDNRGFDEVYAGYADKWWSNIDLDGNSTTTKFRINNTYRVDVATQIAGAFIEQHKQDPFFLFVSYFAPHVPLAAPAQYLEKFSHIPGIRRKYALAMMAAVDDGVGRITEQLQYHDIDDNTLVFFISDNGAPLGTPIKDIPVTDSNSAWNGSLNEPLLGEKGMLTEGGIRVPFIASWPGVLPGGAEYNHPVTALDITATSVALSGRETSVELDGHHLVPELTGATEAFAQRPLYWKLWSQSAVRQGDWKYLSAGGDREYLFNLATDQTESRNLIEQHPTMARQLRAMLNTWTEELPVHRDSLNELNVKENRWYPHYLD